MIAMVLPAMDVPPFCAFTCARAASGVNINAVVVVRRVKCHDMIFFRR